MPNSIAQLIIGMALASAIPVVNVSAIGSAIAQSSVTQLIAQEGLTNRYQSPVSETDFWPSDVRSSGEPFWTIGGNEQLLMLFESRV